MSAWIIMDEAGPVPDGVWESIESLRDRFVGMPNPLVFYFDGSQADADRSAPSWAPKLKPGERVPR